MKHNSAGDQWKMSQAQWDAKVGNDHYHKQTASGHNANDERTGGIVWQETDNGIHVTMYDAYGRRRSYDQDADGNVIHHDTNENINRSRSERHEDGAYNGRTLNHQSSDADLEAAGYYRQLDGNIRHK